jgi:hypothetical protein
MIAVSVEYKNKRLDNVFKSKDNNIVIHHILSIVGKLLTQPFPSSKNIGGLRHPM